MTKPFKTYRQQLRILRNRGLTIIDGSRVMRVLEKENYYNLINGYKRLFLDHNLPNETYRVGADFFEIYALYQFDRELRSMFLKQMLKFENNIKSAIAFEFSQKYGHDNYLKISNFDLGQNNANLQNVSKLIASIQNDISRQIRKHSAVTHYMEVHGYVPLWVLVNILTMGTISKFFSLMKVNDRQHVARRYGIPHNHLKTYLSCLSRFRNLCAHDERFYNFKMKERIEDNQTHANLNLPRGNNGYICGKKDVFALLITLKIMLERRDFLKLYGDIVREVDKLNNQLATITINDVLSEMGFPQNWRDIRNV